MSTVWQQFVTSRGAVLDGEQHTAYFAQAPYPTLDQASVIDLSAYRVLDLKGPDCVKFLQGQITQDAKELARPKGFFCDHCNPKGRIVASFYAQGLSEEHIRLVLPANNADFFAAHLRKYLVFSKAELTLETNIICLALHQSAAETQPLEGSALASLLAEWGLSVPDEIGCVASDGTNAAYRASAELTLLTLTDEMAQTIWQAAAASLTAAGLRLWQALAVQQGVVWVDASNRESYTPHQVNHQLIDAISFKKGCYTGQEVVARMHYKATLKSHTYGFTLTADTCPVSGDAVFAGDQKVGELITFGAIAENQWVLLAEVRDTHVTQALHLAANPTEKLHQMPLPYAINK